MRGYATNAIFACLVAGSLAVAQAQMDSGRKLARSRPPVYPSLEHGMNLEGSVKLRVTESPSGAAKSTEVLGGNAIFSKAAQDAVANWKWVLASQESQVVVNVSFHA